jgi:hypothetical protein
MSHQSNFQLPGNNMYSKSRPMCFSFSISSLPFPFHPSKKKKGLTCRNNNNLQVIIAWTLALFVLSEVTLQGYESSYTGMQ